MPKNPKHNKKRNTIFIYEALLREVVKQSVSHQEGKRNIAIKLLRESFKKGTCLRKELDLYKALIGTTGLSEKEADKLVNLVMTEHATISRRQLYKEQSAVIAMINKQLSKSVFSNFVPNYKSLATVAQMFAHTTDAKSKVLLESKVITTLTQQSSQPEKSTPVPNLVMKTFTKRFNETYDALHEDQKRTLALYIGSAVDKGTEFKFFLNEEIGRLNKIIEESKGAPEIQKNNSLLEKLHSVQSSLLRFNETPVDQQKIVQILRIQNLARELQS